MAYKIGDDCIACGKCAKLGRCVFDDAVNELAEKFEAADGLLVASPVYYASANATLSRLLSISQPGHSTSSTPAAGREESTSARSWRKAWS